MKQRIAAIIPLYNGRDFIRESLESVIAQTVPVDEIIVVDDGSTDAGGDVVDTVMRENAGIPIRLLRKENGGQSSARNLGMTQTSCDLIALLDQDDAWHRNHIEVLKQPFEGDALGDIGVVYGNLDRIDLAGRIVHRNFLDACPSTHPKTSRQQCLSQDLHILPGASLMRRSAVEAAGWFDERLCGYEDDDLFLRMFSMGFRLTYLNVAVTKWRIHAGSTSFSDRMAKSQLIYFHKLTQSYPDEPALDAFWTTEMVAPRFFREVVHRFLEGLRHGNEAQADLALQSAKEIAPHLPHGHVKAFNAMLPIVELLRRLNLRTLLIGLVERKMRG